MANLAYCPTCSPAGKHSRADCPACAETNREARKALTHDHPMTVVVEYRPVKVVQYTDALRYSGPPLLRSLARWLFQCFGLVLPGGGSVMKDLTQFPAEAGWEDIKDGRCIKCGGSVEELPPTGAWGKVASGPAPTASAAATGS